MVLNQCGSRDWIQSTLAREKLTAKIAMSRCTAGAAATDRPETCSSALGQAAILEGQELAGELEVLSWNIQKASRRGWAEDLADFGEGIDLAFIQEAAIEARIPQFLPAGLHSNFAEGYTTASQETGVMTLSSSAPSVHCNFTAWEPWLTTPKATKATKTERDPDSHIEQVLDLGFVGEPTGVDTSVIEALLKADSQLIPVVAPVAMGPDGHRFNVNADTAAGALAEALGASRLLLLTDVAGVLDKDKNLMRDIKVADIPRLIEDGTAVGGMIPKLETAAHSVNHGVGAAVILDGRAPHALLMELFTEHGAGTLIS